MAVLVVFRSRVRPEHHAEYAAAAAEMEALARAQPGFVSARDYNSDDGEHVSVQEWESLAHVRAWGRHPEHRAMQALGRARFYAEYAFQVAEIERDSRFPA